jgi:hypothetical protein
METPKITSGGMRNEEVEGSTGDDVVPHVGNTSRPGEYLSTKTVSKNSKIKNFPSVREFGKGGARKEEKQDRIRADWREEKKGLC